MGYRSEVRCLIYGSDDDLRAFIMEKTLLSDEGVFQDFKSALIRYKVKWPAINIGEEDKEIYVLDLFGDGWKWYNSYPDVQGWMRLLEEVEESNLQYEFIRIGEDVGDVEKRSSSEPLDLLSTTNPSISENFDKEEELPLLF